MDDNWLRVLPIDAHTCINCDLDAVEDSRHLVMQCPYTEDNRIIMHHELRQAQLERDSCEEKSYEEMVPI